jgi:hypothetical protein
MRERPGQLLQDNQIEMKYRAPKPEDYDSEEEYLEALDIYEAALYWEEERAMEKYYEEKNL